MAIKMLYRVDFYADSIDDGKSVFSLEPTSVPYAFAVGDFLDPAGWPGMPLPPDQHYQITAVEHELTCPGGDECQHNVQVRMKAVRRRR
jgi:hypothetical protein